MLDELKAVDTGKHEIVIKHQLFTEAGDNIPLDHEIFRKAYCYAKDLGYKTTSSVFDFYSLQYLLNFDIPFVKIANNRSLDWLISEVPRNILIYKSVGDWEELLKSDADNIILFCVSKYPSSIEDYSEYIPHRYNGISDHTTNWDLFNKYNPEIYECHYKLPDSTGLDAGEFARTPEMLREIL